MFGARDMIVVDPKIKLTAVIIEGKNIYRYPLPYAAMNAPNFNIFSKENCKFMKEYGNKTHKEK